MESPLTTKAVLLQALLNESAYGSAIIERVKIITRKGVVLHSGSVYPALVSMEKGGLIRRRVMQEPGRACFYELTRKGRQKAEEERDLIKRICRRARRSKSGKNGHRKRNGSSDA